MRGREHKSQYAHYRSCWFCLQQATLRKIVTEKHGNITSCTCGYWTEMLTLIGFFRLGDYCFWHHSALTLKPQPNAKGTNSSIMLCHTLCHIHNLLCAEPNHIRSGKMERRSEKTVPQTMLIIGSGGTGSSLDILYRRESLNVGFMFVCLWVNLGD